MPLPPGRVVRMVPSPADRRSPAVRSARCVDETGRGIGRSRGRARPMARRAATWGERGYVVEEFLLEGEQRRSN